MEVGTDAITKEMIIKIGKLEKMVFLCKYLTVWISPPLITDDLMAISVVINLPKFIELILLVSVTARMLNGARVIWIFINRACNIVPCRTIDGNQWENTWHGSIKWKTTILFMQEHDRTSYSRRRTDVRREWKRNDTFAAHTSDGDDEGPHSLHLQASRKFQEHLYRWVLIKHTLFLFSSLCFYRSLEMHGRIRERSERWKWN